MSPNPRAFIRTGGLAIALAAAFALTASAQQPSPQPPAAGAARQIALTAGRSTVLTTDFDVERIAITNPAIADATVVQPREVLIDGKGPGTVSLIVWGGGSRTPYDIVVAQPVTMLQQQLQELFPGEEIHVNASETSIVLSGRVSSNPIKLRAAEIALASAGKASVINMLQLPGGDNSRQVMLQVRFAEVNRRALTELGASFFTSPLGIDGNIGRLSTQQFAAPGYEDLKSSRTSDSDGNEIGRSEEGKFTFSDFLNLFFVSWKWDAGVVVRALKAKGMFQSLAEPNLIAYDGQEASFLAGGEIPVPVVQGVTGAVSVQWKEFGVRLNFKPTIAGDTIRLHVRPEVSTLDFPNGITLQGFRIPALSTRRAETDVELRDGQSFAIAGLLDNMSQDTASRVPLLGDLPIIGTFFRSKAMRAERTELMVLITPRLVRALNPDEVPPLPTLPGSFLPQDDHLGAELRGGGGVVDAPRPGEPAATARRRAEEKEKP